MADDFCVISPQATAGARKVARDLCGDRILKRREQPPCRVTLVSGRAHQAKSAVGRPPGKWIRRCIGSVKKKGGADPKRGGPGAICGALWYRKLSPSQRAKIRREYEATATHPRKFIRTAIQKPGVLRAYVLRTRGTGGFDQKGRIRCEVLREIASKGGIWARRARFAMNLRGMAGVPCPVR